MKIIVGLGNPGRNYQRTRHNIGFQVVDHFSQKHNIALQKKLFKSLLGCGIISSHHIIVAKPLTFMNLSGYAVAALSQYYKIAPKDIIIVHDDIDIEFGRLKIKTRGGSGGHKGITSIIEQLNDDKFVRIRVGIGRPPPGTSSSDFVLQPFDEEKQKDLKEVIERIQHCIETILTQGTKYAMNTFHIKKLR